MRLERSYPVVQLERSFGEWIRQRRRALDLTQAELADLVGYAAITIRRVEAGSRRPSKDLIDRLAQRLDVPEQERAAFGRLGRTSINPAPDPADLTSTEPISSTRRPVPFPLSEMFGRSAEESRVLDRLRDGARLVTISGPGGVGKTRLAMAVGHRCAERFDEVCWVPLAGLTDPDLVLPAVAEAMGVGMGDVQRVRHIAGHHWLVVLDELEHLLDAAPRLIVLLQSAPTISMLVTTRVALRVPGEVEVALPPLAVLPEAHEAAVPEGKTDCLLEQPAIALFVAAARRAQPDFTLTSQNAAAVVDVCRQVDGLPLGLEMAASTLRVLSVHDLAARATPGDWPPPEPASCGRHDSLQATLDTSFALLSQPAQTVLARLSVFVGDWSLAAAEAVCSDAAIPRDRILALLAELRDHSMITLDPDSPDTRYGMLATIHRYAQQRLADSGDREEFERRHIDYFSALAGDACGLLISSHQVECLALITQDLDNFRAATDRGLTMSVRTGDPVRSAQALRMSARLERFWSTTGRSVEGVRRIRDALSLPVAESFDSGLARMDALGALTVLEGLQQHFDQAWRAGEEMRQLAERAADLNQLCTALRNLGTVAVLSGDLSRGENLLRRCLTLADERPAMNHVMAWSYVLLGSAAYLRDDLKLATRHYAEALPRLREVGDVNFLALTLRRQAQISLRREGRDNAVPLLTESLRYNRELRSPAGMAACLVALAEVSRRRGKLETAAQGIGRAEALLDASGERLARPDQEQYDRCRAALQADLGVDQAERLVAAGSQQPWERLWLIASVAPDLGTA